jgi:hypothetical protein
MSTAPICPCCGVQWPPQTPACPGCRVPFTYARLCGHLVPKARERRGLCGRCYARLRRSGDLPDPLHPGKVRQGGPVPFWTPERNAWLEAAFVAQPVPAIAAECGRSVGAVLAQVQLLGLHEDAAPPPSVPQQTTFAARAAAPVGVGTE